MEQSGFDMDELMTIDVAAQSIGATRTFVMRLARQGLIEPVRTDAGEQLLPGHTIVRLRRMRRLHRDLGVNFAGAAVIVDLVKRIEQMDRELTQIRRRVEAEASDI